MKRLIAAALAASAMASASAADIGMSVSIGQPGFYGQINIGDIPRPPVLINSRPMIVGQVYPGASLAYLRVPPGHQKNWSKHCREYNACNRPVHFVDDAWYTDIYAPQYRERHGNGEGHGGGQDNGGHGRGKHGKGRG